MSYFIEFGQSWDEAFYQEFLMIGATTDEPLPSAGIDHQLKVSGEVSDYGEWLQTSQIVASNSNGLIYPTTEPGVSAINVPPGGFFGISPSGSFYPCGSPQTQRCSLIAVPTAKPTDAKTIFTGTITFGASTMNPRLQLKAYPLYPAPSIPSPSATQVKIQLATVPGDYDLIEAALPASPVDPARATWASGGRVAVGGPLYNVIANTKQWSATSMAIFLAAAAAQAT